MTLIRLRVLRTFFGMPSKGTARRFLGWNLWSFRGNVECQICLHSSNLITLKRLQIGKLSTWECGKRKRSSGGAFVYLIRLFCTSILTNSSLSRKALKSLNCFRKSFKISNRLKRVNPRTKVTRPLTVIRWVWATKGPNHAFNLWNGVKAFRA